MAEAKEPLTSTYDAFGAARGVEADEGWAFALSWHLMMSDVDVDQVREGLEEALDVVRATGESPEQLFGSASEHADALQDQWIAEGRLVLADNRDGWPEVVRLGIGMSVAYAVLLGVVTWVRGDLTGTGAAVRVVLIALAIGMGGSFAHGLWTRRHHRRAPSIDAPGTNRAWTLELTEILRTRYAMSGPRARRIVAEAQAHALETGRPVEAEFGTPTAYAARFAPDLRRRSRLTTAFYAVVAACAGLLLVERTPLVGGGPPGDLRVEGLERAPVVPARERPLCELGRASLAAGTSDLRVRRSVGLVASVDLLGDLLRRGAVLVRARVELVGVDHVADGGVSRGLGVESALPVGVADPLARTGEDRLLGVLGVGVGPGLLVARHDLDRTPTAYRRTPP